MYDITNAQTFEDVERWVDELRQHTDDKIVLMLVGNKVDLLHLRAVEKETATEYARQNHMHFIETSALNATNVDVAFESTLRKVYDVIKETEAERQELENEHVAMLGRGKVNGERTVNLKEETGAERGPLSKPSCCS